MKKKIISITIIAIIIAILAVVIYIIDKQKSIVPTISLIGEETIQLNLNDIYTENGAKAYIKEKDKSNLIVTEGEIDTSKPGEYNIKYTIANEKNTEFNEIQRKVIVKDNIPPTIELKGKVEDTIYQNSKYDEPGYTANDNYDGDISNKVEKIGRVDTSKVGIYEITYSVEDSCQNKAEAKRIITVKEKSKPVINTETSNLNTKVRGLPVLMYHFFYDKSKGETGRDGNWMEISDFEEQMKYLSDNKYYFPSWDEVEAFIDGKLTLPAKSIVITIDDGDQTFIDLAIPIIEKYNVKATSFVVTSWNGDWLPKTYNSSHLDFQSHSHDAHRAGVNGKGRLVNMTYEEAVEDVTKSMNIIGNSTIFCYPFGHYNDTVINALIEAKYRLAFTTKAGRVYPGANKFALPRVRMSKGISMSNFKELVK